MGQPVTPEVRIAQLMEIIRQLERDKIYLQSLLTLPEEKAVVVPPAPIPAGEASLSFNSEDFANAIGADALKVSDLRWIGNKKAQ